MSAVAICRNMAGMARYGFQFLRATSNTTDGCAALEAPSSAPRRYALFDLIAGSDASPADQNLRFSLQRSTTASSNGGTVVPNPLDPADAATSATARTGALTNGSLTAGAVPLSFALNQKATFRWVAAPNSEIVIPATASAGLALLTPVAGGTPQVVGTILFEER